MHNSSECSNEAQQEKEIRRRLRGSLDVWAEQVLARGSHHPAAHHHLMMTALQKVASGGCDRLMLLMPPGSAKSTYASVLFPAWWLQARPGGSLIACAHTNALARNFGRRVRGLLLDNAARLGCRVKPGHSAAQDFSTDLGSSYLGLGVHAHVTGRRADLVLIDDPISGIAEASSARSRDRLWSWYRADLATRLKPGGAVVLAMTRWHRDDLAGRLLDADDRWEVIKLPALAEIDDPLGRTPGAALWPGWEDEGALARKRAMVGEQSWAALYQQRPVARTQRLFATARIDVLDEVPILTGTVRAWDLASSVAESGDPDWTVGVKLGRTVGGLYVVLDVARLRAGPAAVERAICECAQRDGKSVRVCLPQDPGQAGRSQILYLTRQLAGYAVNASPETGSKTIRAMPVAAQIDAGNLAIMQAKWNREFVEELSDFPDGSKDDQVDALSRAFMCLLDAPQKSRRLDMSFISR